MYTQCPVSAKKVGRKHHKTLRILDDPRKKGKMSSSNGDPRGLLDRSTA